MSFVVCIIMINLTYLKRKWISRGGLYGAFNFVTIDSYSEIRMRDEKMRGNKVIWITIDKIERERERERER